MLGNFGKLLTRRLTIPATAVRRLIRGEAGAATVEFAIVAVPFLALVFAILETAFIFFAQQALEDAAVAAGRLIMTGQAQQNYQGSGQPMTASQFKAAACAAISGILNCNSNLIVDVQTYASFAAANAGNATGAPLNAQGVLQVDPNNPPFNMGGPSDIVVVVLMYQWPAWVTLPGLTSLMDLASGSNQPVTGRLLMATSVFMNEPYQTGS
jgi:Flp pilus assembly protein TadG